MITTITLLLLTTILIIIYLFWVEPKISEYKSLKRNKEHTDSIHLYKQGSTSTFGPNGLNNPYLNYNLRSWDGGKNWYVVDYNFKTKEFKVLGDVEIIHPGLLKHLEGWDNLTDYVSKNGEIKLGDTDGLNLLKGVGFTITNK